MHRRTLRRMHLRYVYLALVAIPAIISAPGGFSGLARAQVPGNCELGRAEGEIDVGDVYAKVFNTGSLFFGNTSQAAYLVPKNSGRSPIFAASLWVGGLVDGELRVAGATYHDFEFWPGPLDATTGRPPNPDDCSAYDRIWRVSRGDVAEYYRAGVATTDMVEWPFHLGAPVIDGDGDPDNYDLAAGDQPAISGDQMLWWVMNDVGSAHRSTHTAPVGLEVQVSVFGIASGPPALNQATYYSYRLRNAGPSMIDSAYAAIWSDVDLGDAVDDYTGSDTLRGYGYVFNADNQDGSGTGGTYGPTPPALAIAALEGPVGLPNMRDDDRDGSIDEPDERLRMSGFMSVFDWVFPQTHPSDGRQMYNTMQGRWLDGTRVTLGGTGLNPGSVATTPFMFPGNPIPPQFWSQRCPGSTAACGAAFTPQDQTMMVSSGPFRLASGAAQDILFGIVFAQGTDYLDSVMELRAAVTVVRAARDAGLLDAQRVPGWPGPPAPPAAVELRRPAPNPFTDEAVMSVTLPAAAGVRVALVDVLGREVAVLADGPHEAGPHPIAIAGAGLTPGVYVARVWVNGQPAGALPLTRR